MPALFIYLIKVNVALLIFCLGYYAVLRHLTFYTLNRVYLVTAIIFSTLYPFINLSPFVNRHQEIARPIQVVVVNWQAPTNALAQTVSQHNQWYWLQMAFWAGVLLFTIKLATQLLSLYRLHKQSEPVQIRQYMIRVIKGNINPFSFWQNIYVNPANHPPHELDAILEHEQIHVNEWHTLDILLGEVSTIFYWFNPGIWLMKRAIRENIEFITDRKILLKGMDCKTYQYSLINVNFNAQSNAIVNHFNLSTIKKRIIMMNAKRSSSLNLTRYMFLVPTVIILLLVFSVSKAELNKAAKNGTHLFNKALKTVASKFNINTDHTRKSTGLLKAVSGMYIPADSLNIQPKLSGLTFAADTDKLNLGEAFIGVPIYIDAEKSTRDDLLHLDAGKIAKMILYTDIPKNDHDNNVKEYLFVITKKNAASEKVNSFLKEFQSNDSTAIAHNYTITPTSEISSNINMSSTVYPASVMNSIYSKTGIAKRTNKPEVINYWVDVDAYPAYTANMRKYILNRNTGTGQSTIAFLKTRFNNDSLVSTFTDENGVSHKPIVSTLKFLRKPDSGQSTPITKMRLNGITYTKAKADTFYSTVKNGTTNSVPDTFVIAATNKSIAGKQLRMPFSFKKVNGVNKTDTTKDDNETLKQFLSKMDNNNTNNLKPITKIKPNGVTLGKTKTDSLLKAMQGWKVDKNGEVTKSGGPKYFVGSMFGGGPIDLKDKLIIIDGKEATEKQLKKLSADKIGSISNMARDTALSKYGKKAINGVVTISTKKEN